MFNENLLLTQTNDYTVERYMTIWIHISKLTRRSNIIIYFIFPPEITWGFSFVNA